MKFFDIKKEEVKTAFSIEIGADKAYVKFAENGKIYIYNSKDISVISEEKSIVAQDVKVYKIYKMCYKCNKETSLLTYIVFDDGTNENVQFPYDKNRLLKRQSIAAHMMDSSIEYYGLDVLGENPELDKVLIEKYPNKIKEKYSRTINKTYAMNLCDHCGAGQGTNYVLRIVNEQIHNMIEIEEHK